jgi:hypothetical protein
VSRGLAQLVPLRTLDAALGDLAEERALRAQGTTTLRASRWYWGQLARSLPQMMWIDIRRQGWVATCAVALGAWVVAGIVESIADQLLIAWFGSDAPVYAIPGALVGLASLGLGGYLAALIRPAATKVLAVLIALFVVVLMIIEAGNASLWYGAVFLVFGPFASLAGGAWRKTLS